MRILVAEDEVKMAGLLRRGLREEGHAVDVAATGDDAIWMARAVEYDAVVLDLMLPGVDGVEVLPFEVTSILILVAIIGAVVLARKEI